MAEWTENELFKIGNAEELEIAWLRADHSLSKRVIIWVVRVGSELYVRSVRGEAGGWYRGVLKEHAGRILAGGVEKEVDFVEESDPALNDQIDAAYLSKYRRYPQYVAPMVKPEVRATTIRLAPRHAGAS